MLVNTTTGLYYKYTTLVEQSQYLGLVNARHTETAVMPGRFAAHFSIFSYSNGVYFFQAVIELAQK